MPRYRAAETQEFQRRWREWVELSHSVGHIDPVLTFMAQQVGRLDADLAHEAAEIITAVKQPSARPESEGQALTDHVFFSTLWVFAAYELIRTLDARLDSRPVAVTEAKRLLERVRVPLAKLEPARRYAASDLGWPGTATHPELGIGWLVAPRTLISRVELSEKVRAALRASARE